MSYSLQLGQTTDAVVCAAGKYLNRHGLITGATGGGKSVSLMGMVEGFQRLGVPTFVTDIKGDLSGLAAKSEATKPVGLLTPWWPEACDVVPLDVYGVAGVPMTASLSAMGAPLVARALGLSDAQSGVLEIVFALAEDEGIALDSLAKLRHLVAYCADNRAIIGKRYGLVTPSSVAAIGRAILGLERSGGAAFFSANTFDIGQLTTGRAVHLLHCVELHKNPRLYGAVMLWILDALYRSLPEVGDLALPKLAVFIDEAHLLFTDAPPALVAMVESTVRLIRSKGVGVYFATQAPSDLPDAVARQLHLRVQHALRAVTPRDRAMIRGAADSLPAGDGFRCSDVIEKLAPGVALVTAMGEDGLQTRTRITAMSLPRCRLSPLTPEERHILTLEKGVTVAEPSGPPAAPAPRRAKPLKMFAVTDLLAFLSGCAIGVGLLGVLTGSIAGGLGMLAGGLFGRYLIKFSSK